MPDPHPHDPDPHNPDPHDPSGSPDPRADADPGTAGGQPVVAKLTSARMPADRGISSLALLMQLGGSLGVVFAGMVTLVLAFGGAGDITGALFLIAVASGIRSSLLRTAGTKLLYGTGTEPQRSVRIYLWVAFGHAALSLLILRSYLDGVILAKVSVLLLSWPAALAVYFSRPQVKALMTRDGVPHGEDYGFEGAAVLMTLFGIMGTLFTGFVLKGVIDNVDVVFSAPATTFVALIVLALFARSVIHALAGLKGISGAGFDESSASAKRYYDFGILSSVCIGVILFVIVLMSSQSFGAALIMGSFTMPMLLAWPQILRRLYSERNFHVILVGSEAQTYQRAPDAGLIALGWTLTAVALYGLGLGLAQALLSRPPMAGGMQYLHSPWWSVAVSGLQLWAGIELIRMSERHKLAAMIYGVTSIGVVVYLIWPAINSMSQVFAIMMGHGAQFQQALVLFTGLPLVLAVGAIVLVNRVTVPAAVVHNKRRGQEKPAS